MTALTAEAVVVDHTGCVDESARVAALRELDLLRPGREQRFDAITRLAAELFEVGNAAITVVDVDRQYVKSDLGRFGECRREHSFCSVAIERAGTLVVEDARRDPRFADNPFVVGPPWLRFYAGRAVHAPSGHPIGALCLVDDAPRSFTARDTALLASLAAMVDREIALDADFEHAASVQRGLLPKHPPRLAGWDVAGACAPARAVGGDLFDWYPIAGGLALTLADVMGKGLGAALVMATVKAVVRAGSRTGDLSGALCLAADALESDFEAVDGFVTAFHALLDPLGGVSYVDAGHGLGFVVRAGGQISRLESSGLPVGAFDQPDWYEQNVQLLDGDVLVVVSDGLLDLYQDPARLTDVIRAAASSGGPASSIVDRLHAPVRRHVHPPADDVTAVVALRSTR